MTFLTNFIVCQPLSHPLVPSTQLIVPSKYARFYAFALPFSSSFSLSLSLLLSIFVFLISSSYKKQNNKKKTKQENNVSYERKTFFSLLFSAPRVCAKQNDKNILTKPNITLTANRCASYEAKYGPPTQCDECKLRSAFDRRDENKKVSENANVI